ncbi:MAG: FKBP-type peptidyl-prolyl cis-trans isomerase [Pseudomonadota bacterium]
MKQMTIAVLLGGVMAMTGCVTTKSYSTSSYSTSKKVHQRQKTTRKPQQKHNTRKRGRPMSNLEKGQNFLAENAMKAGITTTDSGLQYKVVKEGDGKRPNLTDTVEVHYKGTLIDGTEFDSSYSRNSTISFPLNRVIQGWQEGLQLMSKGSHYELFIPSELGYGARGAGPAIGPDEALIFTVELIDIK